MTDIDKIIKKMKTNPYRIKFQELEKVIQYNGFTLKNNLKATNKQFINKKGEIITIKKDNPIKSIYVKYVLKIIEKQT